MIRFRSKAAGGLALAVASITALAACSSSGSSSSAPSTGTVKSGGSITVALDEDLAGFNVLQANDNEFVLGEILQQVWWRIDAALDLDMVRWAATLGADRTVLRGRISPRTGARTPHCSAPWRPSPTIA